MAVRKIILITLYKTKQKNQCWWISHQRQRSQDVAAFYINSVEKNRFLLTVRLFSSPLIPSFDLNLAESPPGGQTPIMLCGT